MLPRLLQAKPFSVAAKKIRIGRGRSSPLRPLANPPFPLERIEEMTAMMGGEGALPEMYRKPKEE